MGIASILRSASVAACVIALVGCGGGGGGGSADPTPTPTEIPPTRAPSATPTQVIPPTSTPTTVVVLPATPTPTTAVVPSTFTPTPVNLPPTSTPVPPTPSPTWTLAPTVTPTPFTGPIVSGLGLADSGGTFDEPVGTDASGRRIFGRQQGAGFILFVEGRPGSSALPVATNTLSTVLDAPVGRPDLQILVDRPLGDGSAAVCDKSIPDAGGVPGIETPGFPLEQPVSDAMNDLACRFRVFSEPDFACTQDRNGNFQYSSVASTVQFCTLVNDAIPFPPGDTIVTVRLRDTAGFVGPAAQIVVRIRGN